MGRMDRDPVPLRQISFDADRLREIFYLLIVPLAVVAILVLGFINHRTENHHAAQQAEANRKQIVILHNALAEACHASTIQYGINTALLYYIQGSPDANSPGAKIAVDSLAGYSSDLLQLTSCQRIEKP